MKKFNLLVLSGDSIREGLPAERQSFVSQLTRRLSREGLTLTVDCQVHLSLSAMADLLPRLPLQQYDLILLLPGHYEHPCSVSVSALFTATTDDAGPKRGLTKYRQPGFRLLKQPADLITLSALHLLARLTGLPRLQQTRRNLRIVLDGLQPCGHNVVLVTPFPHPDLLNDWLRRSERQVHLEEGYRAFIPVFDAYALLDVGTVCFLPGGQAQLNALGHELLGSALYNFFRAGVAAIGDSSSYRRHE